MTASGKFAARRKEEHAPKDWHGGDRTAHTPSAVHGEDHPSVHSHDHDDFPDDDRR
jgi:hypothetical protein